MEFEASGLLARALQHEVDHLNGILFIDRMSAATKVALRSRLKANAAGDGGCVRVVESESAGRVPETDSRFSIRFRASPPETTARIRSPYT